MFASEKVMLEYLGDLLSEVPEETKTEQVEKAAAPVQGSIQEPIQERVVETKAPEFENTSSHIPEPAVIAEPIQEPQLEVEPKLRPITSQVREFKEYEEEVAAEPSAVEKLLQQVEIKQQEEKIAKEQAVTVDLEVTATETYVQAEPEVSTPVPEVVDEIPEEPFQALFFEVAGLVLAVPLQELGGIHNMTEINSLIGKPDWFKGVMLNREKKLNVVDSARWVMPERFNQQMEESIDYQYLITLGQSDWGLAAEKLVETELIQPDAVKWRGKQGKRPWLFGTIKEKMCALLHVSDLIAMLEQGIDARQQ